MSKESDFVKAYKSSGKGQSRPEGRKKNVQGTGEASSLKRRGKGLNEGKSVLTKRDFADRDAIGNGIRKGGAFGDAMPDDKLGGRGKAKGRNK